MLAVISSRIVSGRSWFGRLSNHGKKRRRVRCYADLFDYFKTKSMIKRDIIRLTVLQISGHVFGVDLPEGMVHHGAALTRALRFGERTNGKEIIVRKCGCFAFHEGVDGKTSFESARPVMFYNSAEQAKLLQEG